MVSLTSVKPTSTLVKRPSTPVKPTSTLSSLCSMRSKRSSDIQPSAKGRRRYIVGRTIERAIAVEERYSERRSVIVNMSDTANTMAPKSRRFVVGLTLVIAALLTIRAIAEYAPVETENVPVDRLVTNLEALIAASPNDVRLKFNLARVHAMAFTTKSADVNIWKGNEKEGIWFGPYPPSVPFGHVQPGTP